MSWGRFAAAARDLACDETGGNPGEVGLALVLAGILMLCVLIILGIVFIPKFVHWLLAAIREASS